MGVECAIIVLEKDYAFIRSYGIYQYFFIIVDKAYKVLIIQRSYSLMRILPSVSVTGFMLATSHYYTWIPLIMHVLKMINRLEYLQRFHGWSF